MTLETKQIKKSVRAFSRYHYSTLKKTACEECGSRKNLEIHHPDYNKPDKFITLCRKCHMAKPDHGVPNRGFSKQAPIKVRSETADQIRFLSDKSGLSMTQLLAEIVGAVFQVACTFSALNLSYDYCITENRVTITCEGKSNLQSGSFSVSDLTSEKQVDKQIKKKVNRK